MNYAPVPVIIEKPFSPVQIWGINEVEAEDRPNQNGVQLIRDGIDVTNQNRYFLGDLTAYKVHCEEQVSYFPPTGTPIPLKELEHYLQKGTLDDIDKIKAGFYLGITREEVITNGCPVYMPPFHFKDVDEKVYSLLRRASWETLFEQAFREGIIMPVTTNAGLHNPGCTGRIIFENITEGRKGLDKYFEKDKPFGLIIPIPFEDGEADDESYKSERQVTDIRIR